MFKSIYNIPCACQLMRNGHNVPFVQYKGRGKRIHIYAYFETNDETPSLSRHPYLQVEPSSFGENLFKCGLYQIQKISQTLIAEGKVTVEIVEGEEHLNVQATDISLKQGILQKKMAYLMVSDSTPQSLKLFINKVQDIILTFSGKSQPKPQSKVQPKDPKNIQQAKDLYKQNKEKSQIEALRVNPLRQGASKISIKKQISKVDKREEEIKEDIDEIDFKGSRNSSVGSKNSLQTKQYKEDKIIISQQRDEIFGSAESLDKVFFDYHSKDKLSQKSIESKSKSKNSIDKYFLPKGQKSKEVLTQGEIPLQGSGDQKKNSKNNSQEKQTSDTSHSKSNQLNDPASQDYSQQNANQKEFEDQEIFQTQEKENVNIEVSQSQAEEEQQQEFTRQIQKSSSDQESNASKKKNKIISGVNDNEIICVDTQDIQKNNINHIPNGFQNEQIVRIEIQTNDEPILLVEQTQTPYQEAEQNNYEKDIENNSEDELQKRRVSRSVQIESSQESVMEVIGMSDEFQEAKKISKEKRKNQDNSILNESIESKEKYYQQRQGIESQYEQEQRQIQIELQRNNEKNPQRFQFVSSKIEEIKTLKNLEKIQNDKQPQKQLYKVDRSLLSKISPKPISRNRDVKRKNPFSCESEEEEVVLQSCIEQSDDRMYDDFEADQLSSEEEFRVRKSTNHISHKQISEFARQREGLTSGINKQKDVSVKKLGTRFVFQKNSFNLTTKVVMNLDEENDFTYLPKKTKLSIPNDYNPTKSKSLSLVGQLLKSLPDYVMGNILQFLNKGQLFEFRTISKFFNDAVFYSIRNLLFLKQNSPSERVIEMLAKAKYLISLKIGRLAHVTPADLIDKWTSKVSSSSLEKIHCSAYTQLNEKLLLALLRISPHLKCLTLPFFGKITESVLLKLSTTSKKLENLSLTSSSDSFQRNEKLSDSALALIVSDNKILSLFKIFTVGPAFFERLLSIQTQKKQTYQAEIEKKQKDGSQDTVKKINDVFLRIKSLKINNMILTQSTEEQVSQKEQSLEIIKNFTQLKELKISNILFKARGEWYNQFTPSQTIIIRIFEGLKQLESLSIGQWCTNELLEKIAELLPSLNKIKIIGSSINDEGLEYVLQKMEQLQEVNIVNASRINGHCFETMISRSIKVIKVSFDDYRFNCLQSTFTNQLQLSGVAIQNFKK